MSALVERLRPLVRLQPNSWFCGPASLRHVILAYGKRADVRRLAKLARTTKRKGTSDNGMRRALGKLGYRAFWNCFPTAPLAKEAMRNYLHAGYPILACVDRMEHWIVAIHATARHITICDSSRPGPVLQEIPWAEFMRRLVNWQKHDVVDFEFCPVLPPY